MINYITFIYAWVVSTLDVISKKDRAGLFVWFTVSSTVSSLLLFYASYIPKREE